MNKYVLNLETKKFDLDAESKAIFAKAEADNRTLSADERTRIDAITEELYQISGDIKRAKVQEEREREILRNLAAGDNAKENLDDKKPDAQGFRGFGEFIGAVIKASIPGNQPDERLLRPVAGPSGLNTMVDSEGGFLVQKQYTDMLLNRAMAESQVASRCQKIPIGEGFDGINAPIVDETSRATGSRWGGVRVYRVAQADTVAASKPKLGAFELKLEKLMALCYLTEESTRDASALGTIVERGFSEEFAWTMDEEALHGTGVGQMLGVIKSGALVTVAAEGGQAADTVVTANIVKMRARMLARLRPGSVWFINQDVEPQLHMMSLTVGTGGAPTYLPANGLAALPFDTLYGRPVIPIEQCPTLGDVGDILYANMGEYAIIEKGGIERAESMHVRFLFGENTLRWTVRNNGAPIWKSPLTPAKGSSTLSPFVTLAAR